MKQLLAELEDEIGLIVGRPLPQGTFTPLGNLLISFASAPDICHLPHVLQAQIDTLVELTLESIFEGDEIYGNITMEPASFECILNVSASLLTTQRHAVTSSLSRLLQDLSLFSQSLRLAQDVLSTIRHYTLSEQCVNAVTRMSYCPLCGGYGSFKPCLFFCINTLNGCFADLAEISGNFTGLLTRLRTLSEDLVRELEVDNFKKAYLRQFVLMVRELQDKREVLSNAVSW